MFPRRDFIYVVSLPPNRLAGMFDNEDLILKPRAYEASRKRLKNPAGSLAEMQPSRKQ
jgi:hypothetical protein